MIPWCCEKGACKEKKELKIGKNKEVNIQIVSSTLYYPPLSACQNSVPCLHAENYFAVLILVFSLDETVCCSPLEIYVYTQACP